MTPTRQQRRAKERRPAKKRNKASLVFSASMIALVALGGFGIYFFRANPPPLTRGAIAGEHWHANYKVYVCGKRMTNYPSLEGEIHSHGDGFMHIHPSTPAATADNATLGTFLGLYQTFIVQSPEGDRTLSFPDQTTYSDGDTCPDDESYDVEVTLNGETVTEDPARLIVHDEDEVVIRFGPESDEETLPNPYAAVSGLPDPGLNDQDQPVNDGDAPAQHPTGTVVEGGGAPGPAGGPPGDAPPGVPPGFQPAPGDDEGPPAEEGAPPPPESAE